MWVLHPRAQRPCHPPPVTSTHHPPTYTHTHTLTPPQELNAAVRAMHRSGQLAVLSFSEGRPMRLAYISAHVVPHESAFPG